MQFWKGFKKLLQKYNFWNITSSIDLFFLESDQWPIIQTFLLHIFFYFWPTIYCRTNLSRRLCGMYQLKLEISFHEINWCICNHLAENSIWIHMGARTGQTQIYQKFFFCIIKYVKTHNYNWHKVNTFFFEIKVFWNLILVFFYNSVPKDSTSSPAILWSWCGGYWPTSGIKIVHFHSEKKIMKLNQDNVMLLQQKKLEKYEGVIWKLFCFFVTVTLFYSSRLNSERLGVLSEIRLNRNRLPKIAFLVTELIESRPRMQIKFSKFYSTGTVNRR